MLNSTLVVIVSYLLVAMASATPVGVRVCKAAQPSAGVVSAHLLGAVAFVSIVFGALWIGFFTLLLLGGQNPG
jgi:hypothetical protein